MIEITYDLHFLEGFPTIVHTKIVVGSKLTLKTGFGVARGRRNYPDFNISDLMSLPVGMVIYCMITCYLVQ